MKRRKKEKWFALILTFVVTISALPSGLSIYAEADNHKHTAECYTEEGELMCGLEEGEAPERTSDSDAEDQKLACHTHSEVCRDENGELICGLEEGEAPERTADSDTEDQKLACHIHSEVCRDENGELICGLEEVEASENVKNTEETDDDPAGLDLNSDASAQIEKDGQKRDYTTLQEALDDAGDDETIVLLRDITESVRTKGKNYTLDMNGCTLTAAEGDESTGIYIEGGMVTIKDGTVTGATASGIKAVGEETDLTLDRVCIVGNKANKNKEGHYLPSANVGGGISVIKAAKLELNGCEIKGNVTSETLENTSGRGGGMYIESAENVIIRDSVISGNRSVQGGGIFAVSVDNLEINDSTLSENYAFASGGGIFLWDTETQLSETHVDKNIGSYQTEGAAVYACEDGTFTASGCTFNENYLEAELSKIIPSRSVIHMETSHHGYNKFYNCQINKNHDVGVTVHIESDMVLFDQSVLQDNSAVRCGAIDVDGYDWYEHGWNNSYVVLAYIRSSVIKNNRASIIDESVGVKGSGGISVYDGGRVAFESGAVYDNKITGIDTNANDWTIGCRHYTYVFDSVSASAMQDSGTDFQNYVWMDTKNTVKVDESSTIKDLTWNDEDKYYYFTAMEYVERDVAEIGGNKYTSLAEAVENAGNDETIVLIAGENDEYGTTFAEAPIIIAKAIHIEMKGRTIKPVNASDSLFTVQNGGALRLSGNGAIEGKIANNGELIVDGKIRQLDVILGEGKYITAGENIDADAINITLDNDILSEINADGNESMNDITVIKNCSDENLAEKINIVGCTNPLISVAVSGGNIVIKKDTMEGIFLDGTKGDDRNGGTYEYPVKTFDKAKELLENSDYDKIYITGQVTVTNSQEWELGEGKSIYRYPTYTGNLIAVKGSLDLKDIMIDGSADRGMDKAESLIKVENGGYLTIGDGAVLQKNDVSRCSYSGSFGGAVYIDTGGNVSFDGGSVRDCKALLGGAVYVSGKFTMESGSIVSNEAVSGEYQGNGGGVLVAYDGTMTMNGGVIEGNTADVDGGGIALGGTLTAFFDGYHPKLELNGGTITNNEAGSCGGGIFVQQNCEAVINEQHAGKIFITNNTASGKGSGHFGGGGIYVNGGKETRYQNGIVHIYNVKVSDNSAVVEGGGIAGCITSNVMIHLTEGGVIYDNHSEKAKDILTSTIMAGGTPSPDGMGPDKFISEYMLGGGEYHWKDESNSEVAIDLLSTSDPVRLHTDLKDGNSDIERANDMAEVFITGNTSQTRGGGIGSNGDVVIGTPEFGALKVSKTVSGSTADVNKEFTFTVTLSDKTVNGTYNDMTFKNGIAEFTLKHGETKVAVGLPDGVTYSVTESDNSGYTVTASGDEGTIEKNKVSEAAFNNYKGGGGGGHDIPEAASVYLKAEKLVDGAPAKENDYEFVLKDVNGKIVQRVHNSGSNIVFDRLSFDKTGEYIYTISESVTGAGGIIYDNTVYKVKIEVTKSGKDYKASVTLYKDEEKLPSDETMVFRNKTIEDDTETLAVNKVWNDNSDEKGRRPDSIKVQLYRDGEKYGEPVELDSSNGWSHLWNELEKGHIWTVDEINIPDGYTGTITDGGAVFTITNTLNDTNTPGGSDDEDDEDDGGHHEDGNEDYNNPDNPDNPNNSDNPDNSVTYDDTPKTGDDSNLSLWILLMIASLMGMSVILVILVKNNRKNTK